MKETILSLLLLLFAATAGAQSLLLGDTNRDGKLSVADVTKTANMVIGKEAQQSIDLSPYRVDNSLVAGTWYMPDATSFVLNADGTTTFPGGKTFKFMPSQGHLIVYDATGLPVKAIPVWEITTEYLLTVDYATGAFARYTSSVIEEPDMSDTHEYVDLGLPSGTLWATMNVGATDPEDYGDYFAWGETVPYGKEDKSNAMNYSTTGSYTKTTFSWNTYKYCKGSYSTLTKYCNSASYGDVDNLTELELTDDAAYVNWGKNWRMPTFDQLTELKEKCTWTWVTQNGVVGYRVNGPNGKSIFLPAAGYRHDSSLGNAGSYGDYWSRALSTSGPNYARGLLFNSSSIGTSYDGRCYGQSVRPVRVSQ